MKVYLEKLGEKEVEYSWEGMQKAIRESIRMKKKKKGKNNKCKWWDSECR